MGLSQDAIELIFLIGPLNVASVVFGLMIYDLFRSALDSLNRHTAKVDDLG